MPQYYVWKGFGSLEICAAALRKGKAYLQNVVRPTHYDISTDNWGRKLDHPGPWAPISGDRRNCLDLPVCALVVIATVIR